MSKTPALTLQDVRVSYTLSPSFSISQRARREKTVSINAVDGVSFEIHKGEVVGIIGSNGAGKSTLLQTIAGILTPDSGSIDTHGNKVSLMSLGNGFHRDLSGRENIILSGMLMGYSKAEVLRRMEEIIAFSELEAFIDYPVRTYSSGMYSKLSFAITTILDNDIILIDEVLSVGDERFKQKSFRRLRKLIEDSSHTVVLVSHSLDKVRALSDRVVWMENGRIRRIGQPGTLVRAYMREQEAAPEGNGIEQLTSTEKE